MTSFRWRFSDLNFLAHLPQQYLRKSSSVIGTTDRNSRASAFDDFLPQAVVGAAKSALAPE